MNFETYLGATRRRLLADLEAFLDGKKRAYAGRGASSSEVLQRLAGFTRKGKLIRGGLACLGFEMAGRRLSGAAVRAGTALELMQSALLIHDDIMDRDSLRRGAPSLHRQYAAAAERERLTDPDHYGISMGICAGEVAIFLAFEALAGLSVRCRHMATVQQLFAAEFGLVGLGQIRDIRAGFSKGPIPAREILDLYRYKTARYSFSLPLAMGWVLGDGPLRVRAELESLGEDLGIIFQLKDDDLGLFGDESVLGKPIGSDLRQGKKTLLYLRIFERAGEKERRALRALFGRPDLAASDIQFVRDIAVRRGAVESVRRSMARYGRRARSVIRSLPVAPGHREVLETLLDFSLSRRS